MPDLNTTLHVDMLRNSKRKNSLPLRLLRAFKSDVYGIDQWGDPDFVKPLRFVRDRYLLPYVRRDQTALEIGPGGGRWTRYMLGFGRLYVVDYYPQLLQELRKALKHQHITLIKNNGTDFPGVPDQSIEFLFSFGTFVHLDMPLIHSYLHNMARIMQPAANAVIHYSDKTKIMARENPGFSENTPDQMRQMVRDAGFQVLEEDLTTMWHSSLIRFTTIV